MKSSLLILAIFLIGLGAGYFHVLPVTWQMGEWSTYVLYVLMLLVGVTIGSDHKLRGQFKKLDIRILLVPFSILLGTGLGLLGYMIFFSYPSPKDTLAVGYGLGYYSLSSILISKISGEELGVIALMANLIREITTLICIPIYVRFFGKYSSIAAAGATSSDTTLPMILKYSGKDYVLTSIVNGIVLTLLVPLIINLIYWLYQ
jgi:uncharacterized membrane protein YbjE (DUF340 family)